MRMQQEIDGVAQQTHQAWDRAKEAYRERAPLITRHLAPLAVAQEAAERLQEAPVDMRLVESCKRSLYKRVIHE